MDWLSNLFGGGQQQQEGYRYSMPPMSPEQQQLYDWGYGRMTSGFPEYDQAFNTQWDDYRKQLGEEYQARRGMQPLGTPEISQMSQARATGQANLATQKVNSQQQLYNMLRGLVRMPDAEYTQPQPSGGQNFLSGITPMISPFISSMLKGTDWSKLLGGMGNMFGGQTQNPAQDIYNYQNPYKENYASATTLNNPYSGSWGSWT